jgi:hypothetical protein
MFGGNGLDVNQASSGTKTPCTENGMSTASQTSIPLGKPRWTPIRIQRHGLSRRIQQHVHDTGGWGGVVAAYDAQTAHPLWNWTAPIIGQGETSYQYTIIRIRRNLRKRFTLPLLRRALSQQPHPT